MSKTALPPKNRPAIASSNRTDSPPPVGTEKPILASQSYAELLEKYCFFGSVKSSPQLKDGTLRSGSYDGINEDRYILGSVGSTANSERSVEQNRPAPPSEPKRFTDEELKQRYGILLDTRLQSDNSVEQNRPAVRKDTHPSSTRADTLSVPEKDPHGLERETRNRERLLKEAQIIAGPAGTDAGGKTSREEDEGVGGRKALRTPLTLTGLRTPTPSSLRYLPVSLTSTIGRSGLDGCCLNVNPSLPVSTLV